jgi:nucleotide-binding universal stress UspA family protein
MKSIVVGTDLSSRAGAAVAVAAEEARLRDAVLHVVSVVPRPTAGVDAMIPTGVVYELADSTKAIEEQLAGEVDRLRQQGLRVELHVCSGSAADMLCKVAQTVEADLIVVGNRRMQGGSRVLGSVANRVAHHAPCSVLISRTGD